MSYDFIANKWVFITGSTSGIGKAIAERFARHQAKIVIHGLAHQEQSESIISQLKAAGASDVLFFNTDFTSQSAIVDMLEQIKSYCGGIDILVNNAGMQKTAPIEDISFDDWNTILAVNLSAAFLTMQACIPHMKTKGYGRIINIASVHGLVASRNKAPYCTSKFGLVGLSKTIALECATSGDSTSGGVTINCICPGWVETALIAPQIEQRATMHGGNITQGIASLLEEKQPSQRIAQPEDIASLCLWLSAPEAHNVTGAAIPIDGGWTAQ